MKKHVNIGLIGFGVVGTGTMQLLKAHKRDVESRVGAKVNVLWLCSRSEKKSNLIGKNVRQTTDWREVVNDPRVDLVVELIGGVVPAKNIVTSALAAGKHVVTANKAILSEYWNEIFNLAEKNRKLVYFEAAVGGGVPIVQALNEGLAGNAVKKISGILNGTTNFILTQMEEHGATYAEALRQAQEAGFAESDPSFDVEGVDAAQKISILSSLALGKWVPPKKVFCEGITNLNVRDISIINNRLRGSIKLLAIAEESGNGWTFRVHPTIVSRTHPLASVRNEYNALFVHGNAVDDVMLYGKGAGRLPTSSAVLSDIIFLSRHIATGTAGKLPFVIRREHAQIRMLGISRVKTRYYLRLDTQDKPGVLAKITGILARHNVSLASVLQEDPLNPISRKNGVSIVLITHLTQEANMQAALKSINRLDVVKGKSALIRME